ncbi:DUF2777 family protein [Metabacillus fastidiosus]|uniref:DUF2777 family protein n=1 Tax=Metabacillus fastidiosus TaxID=1458 RepID=UPI002E1B61C7|nr:DUF2777 family protein [Metabacillus fastidiosus]
MQQKQRIDYLIKQERSYITGSVENDGGQLVFYDNINDELHYLDDLKGEQLEIFKNQSWLKGCCFNFGQLETKKGPLQINVGDLIRMRRRLPVALEEMLKELDEKTFIKLIKQLNLLSFSPFDCVYSYNQLMFLTNSVQKKGVSFFHFDNEEEICALQHHFERGVHPQDRLEITTSLGKRILITGKY